MPDQVVEFVVALWAFQFHMASLVLGILECLLRIVGFNETVDHRLTAET